MDYHRNSRGEQTFREHWWMLPIFVWYGAASLVMRWLSGLSATSCVALCLTSFALMIAGAVLIGFAKLPLYRGGRFFTFGVKAIPPRRAGHYRRGWRLFLAGMTLSILLLLSGIWV